MATVGAVARSGDSASGAGVGAGEGSGPATWSPSGAAVVFAEPSACVGAGAAGAGMRTIRSGFSLPFASGVA